MLTVLHVGKYYPPAPGGMERVVQMLCTATRGRLDSRVLAFNRGRSTVEDVVDGVPVTRVGTLGEAGSVPIGLGLPAQLRRAKADVMIVHEPNPSALVSLLAARPRIPYAVWFHSDVVRPWLQYRLFYQPVARPVYRGARRFAVSSPALAAASPVLRQYADRVDVIPFGIVADDWRTTPEVAAQAVRLRGGDPRPIVLFVGRLVPYKGVDVLVKAASVLPIRLVVVGDGPMRASLQALARGREAIASVEFVGETTDADVKAWMHAATVLVLPSVTPAEAFGYVQLEAMASGVPVISTSVPTGVPWVNRHEITGLVVAPGDAVALRAAIARVVDDESLRHRLGAGGLARVRSEFGMVTMADRFVALCEAVARA